MDSEGSSTGAARDTALRQALEESREALTVILTGNAIGPEDLARITVQNWDEHFTRGFTAYRKSVAEAEDFAAIEWTGEGSIVRDHKGREWIDCLGGYGIYDLGLRHPEVLDAVRAQLERNPLPTQELLDPFKGFLSRLLALISPGDLSNAFITNSGTESIEGALKLARVVTGKTGFVCFTGGFHGKSLGALSLISKPFFRDPVGPLLPGIRRLGFGDGAAVEDLLAREGDDIAAVVLEPIQGEAGAVVPPDDFLPRVRAACDRAGVVLIADEVQTGMGRTGKLWAVEHWDVVPDILCVAKSLGGGVMPVGAVVARREFFEGPFDENPFFHSTTFGGGPMACAAAIAAINVTVRDRLWELAATKGERFVAGIEPLVERYPQVLSGIRGRGLLLGMMFPDDETGYRVAAGLFRRGVLTAGTLISATTVRIEPALTIPDPLIDEVLGRLDETLDAVAHGREPVASR